MKKIIINLIFLLLCGNLFAQLQNGLIYRIRGKQSGKFAQTGGGANENGATIHLFHYTEDKHFKWKAILVKPGVYKFQNVNSGKFLAVAGGSRDVYANITQWEDFNQADIQWKVIDIGNCTFKLINVNSNLALAVEGGSEQDGAKLVQWTDDGGADKAWTFTMFNTNQKGVGFRPVTNGFHFANSFVTDIAGIVKLGGLCGGMALAAADYFIAGKPIPSQTTLPANGTPLQSYIYNRHLNSVGDNAAKWAELFNNPFGWRTSEFFNWGLQGYGGGRLEELVKQIDAGKPVPIGLFSPGNAGFAPHHQVLAIGYHLGCYKGDLGNNKEQVKIFIYDSNFPDIQLTLVPNVSGNFFFYAERPEKKFLTYFVTGYNPATPPDIR
jgi:Ricin-type beta-trefoil lectin domain-like